jgi:23S rRNA (guanosine2251-2'-O)-methyltransferase
MALLYGIHAVAETLKATPDRVERICIQRGQKNPRIEEIIDLSRAHHIPFSLEDKAWLDRKAEGQRHQGVLCYAAEMATLDEETILDRAQAPGLLLILDGIEDPHNLGAILRSAELAGVDGVFLPLRRSSSLSAAMVKTSAGAASLVKLARIPNTVRLMESLKKRGYWIAGLDVEAGQPLWEADFTIPSALVLGNEGSGLHRLVKEKCDFLIKIPVRGKISSHNVSVAAGIALYEVVRQRSEPGIGGQGPGIRSNKVGAG